MYILEQFLLQDCQSLIRLFTSHFISQPSTEGVSPGQVLFIPEEFALGIVPRSIPFGPYATDSVSRDPRLICSCMTSDLLLQISLLTDPDFPLLAPDAFPFLLTTSPLRQIFPIPGDFPHCSFFHVISFLHQTSLVNAI